MNPDRTAKVLKQLRDEREISQRDLAAATFVDKSTVSCFESGSRWPQDRNWVEQADRALRAGHRLLDAWDADQRQIAEATNTMRLLVEGQRESERLLAMPDVADADELHQCIADLAIRARREPAAETLESTERVRQELVRRLRQRRGPTARDAELMVALGRACGILAYTVLDLGQPHAAKIHAAATLALANRANHDGLRAWAYGTQSLIYRFAKDFENAQKAASDGLQYAGSGTSLPRLRCGLAQSTSNLGDTARAIELLDQAARDRETCGTDEIGGLFTFTETKQIYYGGSALIWARDPSALRRSLASSSEAIAHWKHQPSPGDEMLSQVYLGIANAKLGELDAAESALRPVLDQPIDRHFSWVRKRLHQLADYLKTHYPGAETAISMREELQSYTHSD
ncbi:helix-turn-helix domain-containing protein [Amycolatopsis anabasis]|uniref:helix-turn-helix domain-containing protein n=1 Tax=Amycolatopsis anabasis TaxID=1840409 RepID=UPI00131E8BEA|nr:helix-turn-helix transcriptional regulator [Amycolatopsis anabasis]